MNHLTTAAVVCCLISVNLPSKPNQGAKVAQQKSQDQPTITTTFVDNNTPPPNTGCPDNNSPKWYASPEWWLVMLGFPTLFFLGWQARETRRSAQVAQDTAETIIAENRPWLLVEFGEKNDRITQPFRMDNNTPVSCSFYVANYGKTPAKLITIKADLVVAENSIDPPDAEVLEISKRFYQGVLPQGESISQEAELKFLDLPTEQFLQIVDNSGIAKAFMWLRGFIQYQHTGDASRTYRTEFSYVWERRGGYWRLVKHQAT